MDQNNVNNQPIQSQQQDQQTPVSLPQKEMGMGVVEASEIIKPSEPEPQIYQEAAEAGVEKVSEIPELTVEHLKAGIQHAKETTPVSTSPSGVVEFLKEVEAKEASKKDTSNSIRWLWELLKAAHKRIITVNNNP
ncbi:hypothetical protein C4559_01175 [Candidatus Microgenomates bacterium]|nr:MAG: hypothetical protein C4559_01175 [Candidatus Microgenomates bacterium]